MAQHNKNQQDQADEHINLKQNSGKKQLKPSTLLYPVPVVLVSCCGLPGGGRDRPNMLTIAWIGTICSDPPMISIAVQPSRYSYQQIKESGEFVVNLVNSKLLQAADFCGVRSGLDHDKFAACGLHAQAMPPLLHAPAVAESPLQLACKVRQISQLGSHDCFMAEIVAVTADAALFSDQGRLCLDKADLLAYMHGGYYRLAEQLGFFGFSVAAPDVLERRMAKVQKAGRKIKETPEGKKKRAGRRVENKRQAQEKPGSRHR